MFQDREPSDSRERSPTRTPVPPHTEMVRGNFFFRGIDTGVPPLYSRYQLEHERERRMPALAQNTQVTKPLERG
jgi:hypothetical protein